MNIVREHKSRICSILYIDSISKDIDDLITYLSKDSDIYVYVSKGSNINPIAFSSIMPVNGYVYGRKTEVNGLIEVLEYVSLVVSWHYLICIPSKSDKYVDKMISYSQRAMHNGMIDKSIFRSNDSSFDFKSNVYKEDNLLDKLKFWRKKSYDINSTHSCDGSIVLIHSDLKTAIELWNKNKSYVNTFKESNIGNFISSSFNHFNIDHLNLDIADLFQVSTSS